MEGTPHNRRVVSRLTSGQNRGPVFNSPLESAANLEVLRVQGSRGARGDGGPGRRRAAVGGGQSKLASAHRDIDVVNRARHLGDFRVTRGWPRGPAQPGE